MISLSKTNQLINQYYDGLLLKEPHLIKLSNYPIIYRPLENNSIIPILTGGGSGHEPSHAGFVGDGMLAAAVYGNIFTPPTSQDILKAIQLLDKGQGVFIIIKNFEADLTVFHDAIKKARTQGISVSYVISHDDISVEPQNQFQMRHRGLAGTIFLHKIMGEAAKIGFSLEDLETLGFALSLEIATIGFAVTAPHLPGQKKTIFNLAKDDISYGIGIHGEKGYRTVPFSSSEQLAIEIVNKLRLKYRWHEGEKFALLVNNLGTYPELEQMIFLNNVHQLLELEGLTISFIKSGKYMTSLDMMGLSVTLCRLSDEKWLSFLTAPTTAPSW